MRRVPLPLIAALLALTGATAVTIAVSRMAEAALNRALSAHLHGAGEAAALLYADVAPSPARLSALMRAEGLEGAYVLDRNLAVLADATGKARPMADLLRTDVERARSAFAGQASVSSTYALGDVTVATGYFPILGPGGKVGSVLALEAGTAFAAPRRQLQRAVWLGMGVSVLWAAALAALVARWSRAERRASEAAARAGRADAISQLAATAAHEIRNPLGVIRGTIELMQERSPQRLSERDRQDLADVLAEVERMRGLTEDLLDLSRDRPLAMERLDLSQLLSECLRRTAALFPDLQLGAELVSTVTRGDGGRLSQAFANLLTNAAQACPTGRVQVRLRQEGGQSVVEIQDSGPGVPAEIRETLFDAFVTQRNGGTGLGLALCRRVVQRHGGSVDLLETCPAGTTFVVRLPLTQEEGSPECPAY